jgi:hypothetical protein
LLGVTIIAAATAFVVVRRLKAKRRAEAFHNPLGGRELPVVTPGIVAARPTMSARLQA